MQKIKGKATQLADNLWLMVNLRIKFRQIKDFNHGLNRWLRVSGTGPEFLEEFLEFMVESFWNWAWASGRVSGIHSNKSKINKQIEEPIYSKKFLNFT